jgi:C1A family cysteine protease
VRPDRHDRRWSFANEEIMKKDPGIFTGAKRAPHDPRDLTASSPEVKAVLEKVGITEPKLVVMPRAAMPSDDGGTEHLKAFPAKVDLTEWCPTPMMQGKLDTCAVHVVAELVEYFERRSFGSSVSPSRRFLFRAAKNLASTAEGDTALQGVYIRQAMGALRMLGAPPEKFCPYPDVTKPDAAEQLTLEPSAFCYALATDYKAVTYYRLDARDATGKPTMTGKELLVLAKEHLAKGIPVSIDFPLFENVIHGSLKSGEITYPAKGDKQVGNHAVLVIGYDDRKLGGALRILNSWGSSWGETGLGWLSYEYVERGDTSDLWTLLKSEWTETGRFGIAS